MLILPVLMQDEVLHLASCWQLVRKDGFVLQLTDHDQRIVSGGITYSPMGGFNSTSITRQINMQESTRQVSGVLSSAAITQADLAAGKYRECYIWERLVDWRDGTLVKKRRWWIQDTTRSGEEWEATVGGLSSWATKAVGSVYSPTCEYRLADEKCRAVVTPRIGTVTAIVQQRFTFTLSLADSGVGNFYSGAEIAFTSGLNAGLDFEVKNHTGTTFELWLGTPFPVTVGDAVSVMPGCDGTLDTCHGTYANSINFGGFPTIPGTQAMYESPDYSLDAD